MPMAKTIADALEGDLDVLLVSKLGAPGNPEMAIGAVDEAGEVYLVPYLGNLGITSHYIEGAIHEALDVLHFRRRVYTPHRYPVDPAGRVVIVVDDGSATGATLATALRFARAKNPAKLVAAVAVASFEAIQVIRRYADDVVCLAIPEPFVAVGRFFEDFSPVSDDQVREILHQFNPSAATTTSA
jgi:predicted phosphoribosyltransferase